MIKNSHIVSVLRRDAQFVWHAAVSIVFIGFASLAVGAAFVDFVPLH